MDIAQDVSRVLLINILWVTTIIGVLIIANVLIEPKNFKKNIIKIN